MCFWYLILHRTTKPYSQVTWDNLFYFQSPGKYIRLSPKPYTTSPKSPLRRPRGDAKKCRKVYGMEHRELWCTQCKWKKACTRFGEGAWTKFWFLMRFKKKKTSSSCLLGVKLWRPRESFRAYLKRQAACSMENVKKGRVTVLRLPKILPSLPRGNLTAFEWIFLGSLFPTAMLINWQFAQNFKWKICKREKKDGFEPVTQDRRLL